MAGGKLGSGASFGGSPVPKVAGFDQEVTSEINVVPMVDIMLVLLIIFMVVTPALAFEAKLPRALQSAPEKDNRVTLGIDNRGQYWVDDRGPVRLQDLTQRLTDAYAMRPQDHVLYMKADESITYDRVLSAIDAARAAGVRRIGAITELPAGARIVRE
jgi:biopolymer transport protein ExbD